MEHKVITEDEFYERFTPCKNELNDNASFDGCLFETYGEELEIVQKTNHFAPKRVWTITETDGKMYYESGYHFVNRLGYFITEQDIEDDVEYTVELEDLTDCRYQCNSCHGTFDNPENQGAGIPLSCPHCGSANYEERCVEEPETNKNARMEDEGDEQSLEGK